MEALLEVGDSVLVLDDTTLDKPYTEEMGAVTWHWSGVGSITGWVKGINLITLSWTDGAAHIPVVSGSTPAT